VPSIPACMSLSRPQTNQTPIFLSSPPFMNQSMPSFLFPFSFLRSHLISPASDSLPLSLITDCIALHLCLLCKSIRNIQRPSHSTELPFPRQTKKKRIPPTNCRRYPFKASQLPPRFPLARVPSPLITAPPPPSPSLLLFAPKSKTNRGPRTPSSSRQMMLEA
jgi:hypothetical protein